MSIGFLEQARRNAVALISLVIAISSLSYNTWRNELTEQNRNVREAGFVILIKLGELERSVFHAHYDKDTNKGNPRTGWSYVLVIKDLGQLMPDPLPEQTQQLVKVWKQNWEQLGQNSPGDQNTHGAELILKQIDVLRQVVLTTMNKLK